MRSAEIPIVGAGFNVPNDTPSPLSRATTELSVESMEFPGDEKNVLIMKYPVNLIALKPAVAEVV